MIYRPFGTTPLLGFILIAGVVQVLATLLLGLAPLEAQLAAERVPWTPYALTLGLAALGPLALWSLRRRPVLAAGAFLAIEVLVASTVGKRTYLLGWASFGEVVAHHFIALLSGAAMLALGYLWWRDKAERSASKLPAVGAAMAAMLLLALHLLAAPTNEGWAALETFGAATWLAAALALVLTRWRSLFGARLAALALLVPYLARLALAAGSVDALVPTGYSDVLLAAVGLAVIASSLQIRPRNPAGVRLLAWALAALAVSLVYVLYRRTFGELDDAVLGLTQSLLAFSPPYPGYVPSWKLVLVMVACFLVLRLVFDALLDPDTRQHGAALGIITVAGLGLTDPQLSLMAGAGTLALLDALTTMPAPAPARTSENRRAPVRHADHEVLLERLSERLGWERPVVLHDTKSDVVNLRGEHRDVAIEIRARSTPKGAWSTRIQLGMLGRGRAPLLIEPNPRGDYRVGAFHRAKGDCRMLESFDDELATVLASLPRARLARWPGGVLLELGDDANAFGVDELEQVLRVCARWLEHAG